MMRHRRKINPKLDAINRLSNFFIKNNRWITEEEYRQIHKYQKPLPTYTLLRMFGTYDDMLQYLEVGPKAEEIKLLKPKPKPAVKKPKAPAKPKVVKPAKAKESKDE